jgi:hypothetical protein
MSDEVSSYDAIISVVRSMADSGAVDFGVIGIATLMGISHKTLEELLCAQQETNNKLDQLISTVVEIAHSQ